MEAVRGERCEKPISGWNKDKSAHFGEDLVGGWLLDNGGLEEGLQKWRWVAIPKGGDRERRKTDWLVGKRIIVEVKTYLNSVSKGADLRITRQFDDYSRWRDEMPEERAVVLARVSWKGNLGISSLFWEDLRHFRVPVIFFQWL